MVWFLMLGVLLLPAWVLAQDRRDPTIQIRQPTTQSSYATTQRTLTIAGVASDNRGVRRVTWRTNRGASGQASGTTTWSFTLTVPLGDTRVTVRAVDAAGNDAEDRLTLWVSSPLEARIDAEPTSGAAPLTVQFTDSSNGSHQTWAWTFGDGATSTASNPRHTYQTPGQYTVSLTITGPGGSHTATEPNLITVTGEAPPPPPPPPPPGPITVEWAYTGTAGEAFQMERCTQPCGAMSPIAAIALTDRQWTDTTVVPEADYCYRMVVTDGPALGPYSNTMCSP